MALLMIILNMRDADPALNEAWDVAAEVIEVDPEVDFRFVAAEWLTIDVVKDGD